MIKMIKRRSRDDCYDPEWFWESGDDSKHREMMLIVLKQSRDELNGPDVIWESREDSNARELMLTIPRWF